MRHAEREQRERERGRERAKGKSERLRRTGREKEGANIGKEGGRGEEGKCPL